MRRTVYIVPAALVERMRRKAKTLKKQTGITHQQALDRVAQQSKRFDSWHNLIQAAKLTEPSERAYRSGLLFAMDRKDAEFDPKRHPHFVPDNQAEFFVIENYRKSLKNPTQSDIHALEELQDYVYFRYGGRIPATLDEALDIIGEAFFFPPQYIWLRGKPIDPFEENDGMIAGDDYLVFRG